MNRGDRSGVKYGWPTPFGLQAINQVRIFASTLTHVPVSNHLHQHPQQLSKRPSQGLMTRSQRGVTVGEKRGHQGSGCQTPSLTLNQSLNFCQLVFQTQWWRARGQNQTLPAQAVYNFDVSVQVSNATTEYRGMHGGCRLAQATC